MKEEMQDQAVNEMQHLGWLAEKMVSKGGHPKIEHGKIDRSTKASDMLSADIKIEKQVAAVYDRSAKEVDDPKLTKLLIRIRDHELYHVKVFSDLKKTVKE
jgi:bacterioferritin